MTKALLLSGLFFSLLLSAANDGFIRNWLVSGPYPSYQKEGRGSGFDTDFLKEEASFVPHPELKAESEFIADWGKLVAKVGAVNEWGFRETKKFDTTWKEFTSPSWKISFNKKFLPVDDYFVVYAVCWIESPEKREIVIKTGSDDDHKIYLNGKLAGKHYGSQGTLPDQFSYKAVLLPGLNRLTYKLVDRTGEADFCLKLLYAKTQKPMDDLKLYTDHPGRSFKAELYQNGYAGNLKFDSKNLYNGPQTVTVEIFSNRKATPQVRLNGKTVQKGKNMVVLNNGLTTLVLDIFENGNKTASLVKTVRAYSRDTLKKENASLRDNIKSNERLLKRLRAEDQVLEKQLSQVLAEREQTYADLHKKYALQRSNACKDAKKSIAEPFNMLTLRSRLCLNGQWQTSPDRKTWSEVILPLRMMNPYFRTWYYPVRLVNPKDPGGKVVPFAGWEDLRLPEVLTSTHAWFRKEFQWDRKNSPVFVCTGVQGNLTVFVNGQKCGSYSGRVGMVEIPLKYATKGKNQLELEFTYHRKSDIWNGEYGILGDLYLDIVPSVRTADVWVKTGWRNAELNLTTEIENHTGKEESVELKQYVVRNGRVVFRLPVLREKIPAEGKKTVRNSEKWANPLLWNVETPEMYDLISELNIGGKIIDRHVQPFGFREFWIHATDFFLNGKRIFLQGDLGHGDISNSKHRDVVWRLLRHDGINIIRFHDTGAQWCRAATDAADRIGMLSFVQMYPVIHSSKQVKGKVEPFEEWTKTPEHQANLENYRRFFRLFRNNPSVVIWSVDNEIFTQAIDSLPRRESNIRNDRVAALYGRFMKTLDPSLVITRDGDIGTWSRRDRWFENPPCDTANYHYPEYNTQERIVNWQDVYDYRPVIFGETLYCKYFDSKKATPDLVASRAAEVRNIAGLYRKLEVPATIFMGVSQDGFIRYDNSGSGDPWGLTEKAIVRYGKDRTLPAGLTVREYPWFKIAWPSVSGIGRKTLAININSAIWGYSKINWFDPKHKTHIRNAVNDAYRETLRPQVPLREPDEGECIIQGSPDMPVWTVLPDGSRFGIVSDQNGKAWFRLPKSGTYVFEDGKNKKSFSVPNRAPRVMTPGFEKIPVFELK